MAEYQEHNKIYEYVKLLIYTASLIKIIRPHISDPITYAVKKAIRRKLRLSVQRISLKKLNTLLASSPGLEPDLNADVFISERKAIIYGVQNGEWYNVFFIGSMCMRAQNLQIIKRRWIRVNIHSDIDDDHCLLSPILFHNLQNGNHDQMWSLEFDDSISNMLISEHVKRVLTLWKEAYAVRESEKVTLVQSSPSTATEVHVQIVESPDYKCGSELEVLLSDAFRTPKLAAAGDIIGLPVPNHLGYEFSAGTSVIPPKYIFIRMSVLQKDQGSKTKESLLISTETTNLYLVGTTHCYLPPLCKNFDKGGTVDVPPVLKRTFNNVTNILQSELRERKQEVLSGERHLSENMKRKKYRMQKSSLGNLEREHRTGGANILMLGAPGSGSEQIIELSASSLNLSVVWADCWHLKGDTSGGTEARLRQIFSRAIGQAPCVLALTSVQAISKDRDGGEDARVVAALKEEVAKLPDLQPPVILIGTAPHRTQVSEDLWSIWSHQECIDVPELEERRQMLEWLLSKQLQQHQFMTLAQRTAGFVFGDLQALFGAAQRISLDRTKTSEDKGTTQEKKQNNPERCSTLMYEDVVKALDEMQSSRSEALGAPRIPQVKWNEVGGLEEAKRQVINTIQLPLRHPSLVSNKLRRSGVLLYGPPGTGKTLLAKAVATECGLNFLSVKGPELLNMYVGQSEENVRQVFSKARAAAPCIIFFDELDSLAPNRGRSGDSGGVMDRIVSALLAELDGVSSSADVFVLAATNRPDLIDPALLRPGRFEKLVFLGVCEDRAGQVKILQAVTSKIPLGADVSLDQVAELLPLTLTGADLYALCTDALYNALHRITCKIAAGEIDKDEASAPGERKVPVSLDVESDRAKPGSSSFPAAWSAQGPRMSPRIVWFFVGAILAFVLKPSGTSVVPMTFQPSPGGQERSGASGSLIKVTLADRERCQPGEVVPAVRVNTTVRVANLREEMNKYNLTAYIIPSGDEHQSEYVAQADERRKYISGFSGSSGLAVVTLSEQALWTDGRYFLQAEDELDCAWILMKEGMEGVPTVVEWLKELPLGATVGADPRLMGAQTWHSYAEELEGLDINMLAVETNLVDVVWEEDGRPTHVRDAVFVHEIKFAGKSWQDKVADVRGEMSAAEVDLLVLTALDEVAWLLNLRGSDIPYNPVFRAYVAVSTTSVDLFLPENKTTEAVEEHLKVNECSQEQCVTIHDYASILDFLRDSPAQKVMIPGPYSYSGGASFAVSSAVSESARVTATSPVLLMKARKNEVEIAGMKNAHVRDAVALCDFLRFLEEEITAGERTWTEISAATELESLRAAQKHYVGLSFASISAYSSNGAVIHYEPTDTTDRAIGTDSLFLLDSGGQYKDGTTDVTRTMHYGEPTEEQIEAYTRVLAGHVDLASVVFPEGTADTRLDVLARRHLYEVGLDYRHGTGHGIGMFLGVHESPTQIRIYGTESHPFYPGYFFSDEPGFYKDNEYGIRLENIVVAVRKNTKYTFDKPSLGFEPVTLVPFESKLINGTLLSRKQCEWLNNYHATVLQVVGEELHAQGKHETHAWLVSKTQPLCAGCLAVSSSLLLVVSAVLAASRVQLWF